MSDSRALHEAVARAIAEQDRLAPTDREVHDAMARAAIRVVLAEAKRSIEAIEPEHDSDWYGPTRYYIDKAAALAVLAALGEQA